MLKWRFSATYHAILTVYATNIDFGQELQCWRLIGIAISTLNLQRIHLVLVGRLAVSEREKTQT